MDESCKGLDISEIRKNYKQSCLCRKDLNQDPFSQFQKWFEEALEAKQIEPNAMVLGTFMGKQPSARTVLLKYFDIKGFVFFTNYKSRKSLEIENNSNVSLLFPWYQLERQVIILGSAKKIEREESFIYFKSRPIESQISAWASEQSSILKSRDELDQKIKETKQLFATNEMPLPKTWGGFRVEPIEFEFWQGRENRLHDRFTYKINDMNSQKDWTISRLSP